MLLINGLQISGYGSNLLFAVSGFYGARAVLHTMYLWNVTCRKSAYWDLIRVSFCIILNNLIGSLIARNQSDLWKAAEGSQLD